MFTNNSNRFINTQAVKSDKGELIPVFLLKVTNNYPIGCVEFEDADGKIYNINNYYYNVTYDLFEKKVIYPSRTIKTLENTYRPIITPGDRVCIGSYEGTVRLDTVKQIIVGKLSEVDYIDRDELKYYNLDSLPKHYFLSDEGETDSEIIRLEIYKIRIVLESGREIDYNSNVSKIID